MTGPFSEKLCRYYFIQILQGLHHIHQQGLCHLDMKLENVLLDSNYDTKIIDFGFATDLKGKDGKGVKTVNGTEGYMAPEVTSKMPYDGQSVDLFACGVILFSMMTGEPPFSRADREDIFYRQIIEKSNLFWKAHRSGKHKGFFSDNFMDLFSRMVANSLEDRICLADVIGHPWLQGEIPSPEEVKCEMMKRHEVLKERDNTLQLTKLEEKKRKQEARANRIEQSRAKRFEQETVEKERKARQSPITMREAISFLTVMHGVMKEVAAE